MTRAFFIATFLLGTAALCLAQTAPQSLGEVARQNRKGKKAAVVLNDDNMRRTAPVAEPEMSAPAKSTVAGAEAKKTGSNQGAAPQQGAGQVADLEKKVASYKEQQEGWKRSAQRYQELLTNETSDFRRQMYQDALNNDQKNAATFKQKAEQAEAELARAREASNHAAKEPGSADAKPPGNSGH
ncbi:MAG TPA: hypothetical protein VF532_19875 [Candidatus Angelobacter sp.]